MYSHLMLPTADVKRIKHFVKMYEDWGCSQQAFFVSVDTFALLANSEWISTPIACEFDYILKHL